MTPPIIPNPAISDQINNQYYLIYSICYDAILLFQGRIDNLTAQLANARFELQETDVRAESDGYVAQVRLRPGALPLCLLAH